MSFESIHSKASPHIGERDAAVSRAPSSKVGLPGRNLIDPPYKIRNAAGNLSDKTINTDLIHRGGWAEYDTHNL